MKEAEKEKNLVARKLRGGELGAQHQQDVLPAELHTHTHTHTHMSTYTHIHTCMHTHTYAHKHRHAYTYMLWIALGLIIFNVNSVNL